MTEPDLSGQTDWARLVKDTRAEKKAAPPPRPPSPPRRRGRRGWLLPVLLVLSLVALGLQLLGPMNPWPPAPTSTEIVAGQLAAMNLAAKALHDYAQYHGRYPEKLEDVLPHVVAIEYVPSAKGFELRAVGSDGKPIVLRSK